MTKTDLEGKVSTLLNEYHTLSIHRIPKAARFFITSLPKPTAGEYILCHCELFCRKWRRKQLPFEIQRHIQEYFCSVTKMKELEEAEYIKFMDYVAIQLVKLPSSRSSQGKGQHCLYLRVDVREVLVRILMRHPSMATQSAHLVLQLRKA